MKRWTPSGRSGDHGFGIFEQMVASALTTFQMLNYGYVKVFLIRVQAYGDSDTEIHLHQRYIRNVSFTVTSRDSAAGRRSTGRFGLVTFWCQVPPRAHVKMYRDKSKDHETNEAR